MKKLKKILSISFGVFETWIALLEDPLAMVARKSTTDGFLRAKNGDVQWENEFFFLRPQGGMAVPVPDPVLMAIKKFGFSSQGSKVMSLFEISLPRHLPEKG